MTEPAKKRPGVIVQALHKIQHAHGYLPKSELRSLAEKEKIPLHRIHEVASFFPHFRLEPGPKVEVKVCRDMSCHLAGAADLTRGLLSLASSQGNQGKELTVTGVSCLGRCDRAPAVCIGANDFTGHHREHYYLGRPLADLRGVISEFLAGRTPPHDSDARYAVNTNPEGWMIDPYRNNPEPKYAAVRWFVENPQSGETLIKALTTGDLRGMGGAGVWAYRKWGDVKSAEGDTKYIVVNGDESEPATFKDREILLRTPHVVLEGVILAGLFTGATRGYVYIRHEYEEQIEAMRETIRQAEKLGVCGDNASVLKRSFPVEVFVSPGGYICGEQSALIEAMEDHRAEPRNKPPELLTNGLFDCPTLVSNVETYAWVPAILLNDLTRETPSPRTWSVGEPGKWYRDHGANGSKGRRFYSISGHVKKPGAYEVPNGIQLGEFLEKYAGGLLPGLKLTAFAPSGPSGGFLPPAIPIDALPKGWRDRPSLKKWAAEFVPVTAKMLDILLIPMDLQVYRDLNLMLGAGVVVYGGEVDIVDQAVNATEFFRNESCGKCVPCRIGSQKLVEIGQGLLTGQFNELEWGRMSGIVKELGRTMEITAICGLGAVAPGPMLSLLRYFPEKSEPYLTKKLGLPVFGD